MFLVVVNDVISKEFIGLLLVYIILLGVFCWCCSYWLVCIYVYL